MAHEVVSSAVFACIQAQFGGKFASQGGERNIMSDIFLAASRDEFLIRFARTHGKNPCLPRETFCSRVQQAQTVTGQNS